MNLNHVKLGRAPTFIEYLPGAFSLVFLMKNLNPLTTTDHCRPKTLNGFCHMAVVSLP